MDQMIGNSERTPSSGFPAPYPLHDDDRKIARLRTHGNNIRRYRRLLQTRLSDIEREFIERRLAEERKSIDDLTQAEPIVLRRSLIY